MATLHIVRAHTLGLQTARQRAIEWTQDAQLRLGLRCIYEEGPLHDHVSFSRPGVQGTLAVRADFFELNAQLGFLLSPFKDRMEAEITQNLDALLRPPLGA